MEEKSEDESRETEGVARRESGKKSLENELGRQRERENYGEKQKVEVR